jgi:hypothetical protein
MAATGLTLSKAANFFGVSISNLLCWIKVLPFLKEKGKSAGVCLASHAGPTSQLAPVNDELLLFIEE